MKKKSNFTAIMNGSLIISALLLFSACNNDDKPKEKEDVVGKWQKYQVMDDDGNFKEGDLDEFWIFNADGSFQNEDGGNVTTTGNYTVDKENLTIYSHSIDDSEEEENFTGTYVIENGYMMYSFTDMEDGDRSTIRFKKI